MYGQSFKCIKYLNERCLKEHANSIHDVCCNRRTISQNEWATKHAEPASKQAKTATLTKSFRTHSGSTLLCNGPSHTVCYANAHAELLRRVVWGRVIKHLSCWCLSHLYSWQSRYSRFTIRSSFTRIPLQEWRRKDHWFKVRLTVYKKCIQRPGLLQSHVS